MMCVELVAQTTKSNFKSAMFKSSIFDYSDSYILVKETITITAAGADATSKQVDGS